MRSNPAILALWDDGQGKYAPADAVCTARWATANLSHLSGDICGAPATEQIGDSEVCQHHYERALKWFHQHLSELPEQIRQQREESHRRAIEEARLDSEARSIVYYLRRADGMIKIGVTSRYRNRLSTLQGEHGKLQLLLAYAGTRQDEREAHDLWVLARSSGEWFRPSLPLLSEILHRRDLATRLGRATALPEQVPVDEIRALVKAVRERAA